MKPIFKKFTTIIIMVLICQTSFSQWDRTIQNLDDFNPVSEFIVGDYITGDYCLIHRLKPISSNDDGQEAEELDISMKPTIDIARKHARYCPVGTVSYEFDKDTLEKQELYFQAYISNLQEQRKSDGLPEYNENDLKLFRGTFTNLGSERIYKNNLKMIKRLNQSSPKLY